MRWRENAVVPVARLREARSFDEWWKALCAAAKEMDFAYLSLSTQKPDGMNETVAWRRSDHDPDRDPVMRITLPAERLLLGTGTQLEAGIYVNGSLESAGRRAALFGRLMDEHCQAVPSAEDASDKPIGRIPRFRRLSLAIPNE